MSLLAGIPESSTTPASGLDLLRTADTAKNADSHQPLMRDLINVGTQFIGFCDEAETLREALRQAEERADALEAKLKSSEAAREKAEKEAARFLVL
ncbi:hypothetical protein QYE76_052469 [Lolium multiflorum]|uniref:Uncharacterized protein n=1 Tax=Lolium multiflorum TaxID=4521 RepID=A0AAD8SUS7_LOLMU|nr:hypothetical protein QYE76_052469 [Lolium multiflorum]